MHSHLSHCHLPVNSKIFGTGYEDGSSLKFLHVTGDLLRLMTLACAACEKTDGALGYHMDTSEHRSGPLLAHQRSSQQYGCLQFSDLFPIQLTYHSSKSQMPFAVLFK